MKKRTQITFMALAIALLSAGSVLAEADTEPPLPLPIVSSTATATQSTSVVTTYTTQTPTYTVSVVSSQEAVDEAETGPNLVILSILSFIAGIGFFLIKKYFDLKRYSL